MSIIYESTPQTSFTPYPKSILPEGFKYPRGYLAHAVKMEYSKYFQWWFVDYQEHGPRAWDNRHYWQSEGWLYLDEIDPIPFARNGDWAAYFDGNDHTGDPRIVVVDLGNKLNSYKLHNFEAWLEKALTDSGLK